MRLEKSSLTEAEYLLHQIISSTELILDDFHDGSIISERNYDQLKLADQILFDIQEELNNTNKPSHLK